MKTTRSFAGAGALLALALLLAAPDGAAAAERAAAAASGPVEGIEVHGHWVIEVRNPDGSLAERREFENALVQPLTLTRLLARFWSMGAWGVMMSSSGGTHPCLQNAAPAPCLVREPVAGGGLTSWSGVTQFSTLTAGIDGNDLLLQGTATAETNGSIDTVETITCMALPPSLDPAACNNGLTFTSRTLGAPVVVTSGQQVLITVRISFS